VSTGPLTGIKVIDLSTMISGPLAGMMLADQGAEVIKVESPGMGDMMRHIGTQKNGMTGIYALHNRGKKSLVVDLKHETGKEVLRTLIKGSDALIQNFRPGAMERLGFGYEEVAALNPRLIYVSIAGFGEDGPNSGRRVYDNVIQATSGLASVQTDKATGKPSIYRTLICDKVTAYTASQAITAALFARERGGSGQHITLSMLDAAIAFTWPDCAMDEALLDDDVVRLPTIASSYKAIEFSDGYAVATVLSESEFRGYCAALGKPELADDPRFATVQLRGKNDVEYREIIRELTSKMTVAQFLEAAVKYEVPAGGLNDLKTVTEEPQVIHNKTFVLRDHPVAGTIREARPAPRFSATPIQPGNHAPEMGADTDEIVTALGFDSSTLREQGIVK
jgi:crotonobetainyl-CoA:carnitine CoA-transferase CaiB-like acyl-CoA transferase